MGYGYVEYKKQELTENPGPTLNQLTPILPKRGTLTYPMRYIAQILPGVTTDVANYKNSLAE